MKNFKAKLLCSLHSEKSDDDSLYITGMASTNDIDRAGDVIISEAWKKGLANFTKNPILLFNHDYNRPIGRAIETEVTDKGLKIKGKISSGASDIKQLILDGVLSAFSVGFLVKDADYDRNTGIYFIKEVELLEVSVVSVPCNQDALFSLAKSMENFDAFKKQFDAAEEPVNTDLDTGTKKAEQPAPKENLMDLKEIEALVDARVAAERKKMEAEAAEKAAKEKAAKEQEENFRKTANVVVETAAEKLLADLNARLAEKDAKVDEIFNGLKAELESKSEELARIQSKATFEDRKPGKLSDWGRKFLEARVLGVATKRGFETNFAKALFEKAGVNYTTSAGDIDQTVNTQIEQEIRLLLRAASLFREIPVISGATVLPIQPDSSKAVWQATGAPDGNLMDRAEGTSNTFVAKQVILNCYRLISSTYLDNDVDEQVLVNFLPMLVDAVVRAHARAVDDMVINGTASIDGIADYATAATETLDISDGEKLTAAKLHGTRRGMGKYGLNTADLAYIVSQDGYYDLTEDEEFKDISDVGSDMALKVTGTVGSVYGVPVVVSDNFPAAANGAIAAATVNHRNYVIPRLRSINLEQDYEVGNQRRLIVASQSLGFEELVDGATNNQPSIRINWVD